MAKKKMRRATIAEIKAELRSRYEGCKKLGMDSSRGDTKNRVSDLARSEAYREVLGILEGERIIFWSQDDKVIGGG